MTRATTLPDDDTQPAEVETAGGDVLTYDHTDDLRKFRERGDERATLRTDGRQIRPWLAAVRANYGDEGILRFDDDGISVRRSDPAKVFLADVTLNADALRSYAVHPETHAIGLRLSKFDSALTSARYGKSAKDPVELSAGDRKMLTTITREYEGGVRVPTTDAIQGIDPDAVRAEPETIADSLKLTHEADVPPKAFSDVVEHLRRRDVNHVRVMERNGKLAFEAIADDVDDISVEFAQARAIDRDAEHGDKSLLSFDYLRGVGKALKRGKATDLTIRWGVEFPVVFKFSRETSEGTLYEGHYTQAPRVQSD